MRLLSRLAAAKRLGVSLRTVGYLIDRGQLPTVPWRGPNLCRIPAAAVERLARKMAQGELLEREALTYAEAGRIAGLHGVTIGVHARAGKIKRIAPPKILRDGRSCSRRRIMRASLYAFLERRAAL